MISAHKYPGGSKSSSITTTLERKPSMKSATLGRRSSVATTTKTSMSVPTKTTTLERKPSMKTVTLERRPPSQGMCDELKCSICDHVYVDPVKLPCDHNVCLTCAEDLVDNQVGSPERRLSDPYLYKKFKNRYNTGC